MPYNKAMHPARIKRIILIVLLTDAIIVGGVAAFIWLGNVNQRISPAIPPAENPTSQPTPQTPVVEESYKGKQVSVADAFSVSMPNGWTASTSDSVSFLAIMFASPNTIDDLVYKAGAKTTVSTGIASWNGLTEHFYIRSVDSSQQFDSRQHQQVSSSAFTFDDDTEGKRYLVIKDANEAAQWGGLQKDSEWQGRTYIYEKNGKRIEAHLAVYPSTDIDIEFFEEVVRSIELK